MLAFGPLNCGNSTSDHRLHLLEGARLNLPHSLARDAEFVGKHSKRDRVFGQAPHGSADRIGRIVAIYPPAPIWMTQKAYHAHQN